jgi:hypothetical protein
LAQPANDLAEREEIGGGEYVARGQGHEFDEAQGGAVFGTESDEGPEFVLVDSPHENGVKLDELEPRVLRGPYSLQDRLEWPACNSAIEGGGQRVQADVHRARPCGTERFRQRGQLQAVGGDANTLHPWAVCHLAHESGQARPQQRLTTREPELTEADFSCHANDAHEVIIGQRVSAPVPPGVLLGAAVEATLVAPIGDRDPQVINLTSERVHSLSGRHHVRTTSGWELISIKVWRGGAGSQHRSRRCSIHQDPWALSGCW